MIFTKMHGLGNDYVCINCFRERVEDPPGFARTLCDRHYGIGADGLIPVSYTHLTLPTKLEV